MQILTNEILEIILLALLVLFAWIAIEVKRLTYTVLLIAVMSVILGAVYFTLNAPFASVFQLIIYGGAVTVLLLAALGLTREEEEKGEKSVG